MTHDDDDDVATKGFVREELGKLSTRADTFEARVDRRFDTIAAMIDANAKRVEDGFEKMDERFVQIDERFVQIDERFVQIDERFVELGTEMKRQTASILEHMDGLMRGAGDKEKALEARLDAHIADAKVHVSAARGPRDRASRRPPRR